MHSRGQEEKQKQPLALAPRRREGKPSPRVSHQTWRHAVSPVAPERSRSTPSAHGAHGDAETKLGKPPPRPSGSFPRAPARELIARRSPPAQYLPFPSHLSPSVSNLFTFLILIPTL